MGYESRIFIVNRFTIDFEDRVDICAEKIADIKLGKMYSGFRYIFNKKIDYSIYVDSADYDTNIDKYGEKLKYASISDVISYLENLMKSEDYKVNPHRRIMPLYSLLKGFNENEWHDLQVVHYGY